MPSTYYCNAYGELLGLLSTTIFKKKKFKITYKINKNIKKKKNKNSKPVNKKYFQLQRSYPDVMCHLNCHLPRVFESRCFQQIYRTYGFCTLLITILHCKKFACGSFPLQPPHLCVVETKTIKLTLIDRTPQKKEQKGQYSDQ